MRYVIEYELTDEEKKNDFDKQRMTFFEVNAENIYDAIRKSNKANPHLKPKVAIFLREDEKCFYCRIKK